MQRGTAWKHGSHVEAGAWFLSLGAWCLVFGTLCLVLGTLYLVLVTWYLVLGLGTWTPGSMIILTLIIIIISIKMFHYNAQGPRVLTAGNMMVRRDKRLQLRGNNLVISQLEVTILIMIRIIMILTKHRWTTGANTIVRSRQTATSPFLFPTGLTSFCLPG